MIDELWCYCPSECLDCGKQWVAVFPLAAADLECPWCYSDNTVRGHEPIEEDSTDPPKLNG